MLFPAEREPAAGQRMVEEVRQEAGPSASMSSHGEIGRTLAGGLSLQSKDLGHRWPVGS
jgi:hypothetical protein